MFKFLQKTPIFSFSQRKIKIWKPKHYEAIPQYVRPQSRDPFEYRLRSKAQIEEEFKKKTPLLDCTAVFTYYNFADGPYQDRDRKVKMIVSIKSMGLTELQKKRLIQLLGVRYKNEEKMTLTCDMYPTPEENEAKLHEMVKELFLEAKRAP